MKICPQCQGVYEDNLNFCLNDGSGLADFNSYDHQRTLPNSGYAPVEIWKHSDPNYTIRQNQTTFGRQNGRKNGSGLFLMVGALFALIGITAAGIIGVYFLNRRPERDIDWYPTPSPTPRGATPYRTPPPPQKVENIKIDILEPVKTEFGQRYLKVKVTNTSAQTVESPSFSLAFYKKDVKIKDAYGKPELPYLKPNQSVPVWVNLYGTENYDSVKLKEAVSAAPAKKSDEQLFPKLNLTDTKMVAEKGGLMYNFRQYYKLFYRVKGVAENTNPEKLSAKIFVLYYDDKGEVVGIQDTSVRDLKSEEKASFEVSECEIDLYGKPQTFEIIAYAD